METAASLLQPHSQIPGKPEDWMNSQVSPGHAKAYSGPYKFISGARIGRKVHTFV